MQLEAELRTNPELRADRFVADWQQHGGRREKLTGLQNENERRLVDDRL